MQPVAGSNARPQFQGILERTVSQLCRAASVATRQQESAAGRIDVAAKRSLPREAEGGMKVPARQGRAATTPERGLG